MKFEMARCVDTVRFYKLLFRTDATVLLSSDFVCKPDRLPLVLWVSASEGERKDMIGWFDQIFRLALPLGFLGRGRLGSLRSQLRRCVALRACCTHRCLSAALTDKHLAVTRTRSGNQSCKNKSRLAKTFSW